MLLKFKRAADDEDIYINVHHIEGITPDSANITNIICPSCGNTDSYRVKGSVSDIIRQIPSCFLIP